MQRRSEQHVSATSTEQTDASGEPLVVPQGRFHLRRHPGRTREGLRAWDSADSLLLHRVAGVDPGIDARWAPLTPHGTTLVIGDAFGSLAVALAEDGPTSVVDSYCSAVALRSNLASNSRSSDQVRVLDPTEDLSAVLGKGVGRVLLRPPRQLALLEHYLRMLKATLEEGTVVVAADMVQHVHRSTIDVFERVIGPTVTSRALRRARLIESRVEAVADPGQWRWPLRTSCPDGLEIVSWPGTFAAGRLDPATALLASLLPDVQGADVVDLGCGTGVLGTLASTQGASVTFVDDSRLALKSAQATHAREDQRREPMARFVWGNSLFDWPAADGGGAGPSTVDLVLTNPPFHEHRAMGDAVAWQMFVDSHRALRKGGELYVVGNRHLAHHAKLRRIFGNCQVMTSDSRYVVARARRA